MNLLILLNVFHHQINKNFLNKKNSIIKPFPSNNVFISSSQLGSANNRYIFSSLDNQVTIKETEFAGFISGSGGAIKTSAPITIFDCLFKYCFSSSYGGAIHSLSTLNISKSGFYNCMSRYSSAIFCSGQNLSMEIVHFQNLTSENDGTLKFKPFPTQDDKGVSITFYSNIEYLNQSDSSTSGMHGGIIFYNSNFFASYLTFNAISSAQCCGIACYMLTYFSLSHSSFSDLSLKENSNYEHQGTIIYSLETPKDFIISSSCFLNNGDLNSFFKSKSDNFFQFKNCSFNILQSSDSPHHFEFCHFLTNCQIIFPGFQADKSHLFNKMNINFKKLNLSFLLERYLFIIIVFGCLVSVLILVIIVRYFFSHYRVSDTRKDL